MIGEPSRFPQLIAVIQVGRRATNCLNIYLAHSFRPENELLNKADQPDAPLVDKNLKTLTEGTGSSSNADKVQN